MLQIGQILPDSATAFLSCCCNYIVKFIADGNIISVYSGNVRDWTGSELRRNVKFEKVYNSNSLCIVYGRLRKRKR